MADPLLSDDLATLLSVLPEDALTEIVGVLRKHRSFTPFPMPVAKNARNAGAEETLAVHAEKIAREILWWGSNEIMRQIGMLPSWRDLLISVGGTLKVAKADLRPNAPIQLVEGAILRKAVPDWERLTPDQRSGKIRRMGQSSRPALGSLGSFPSVALKVAGRLGLGAAAEAGGTAAAGGGTAVASGSAAAGSGLMGTLTPLAAIAAPYVAAAAAVIGAGYTVFELSGPAYRVVCPVALLVARSRQRLRDQRNASAFAI